MLDDLRAGARDHDRRHGGDVDRLGAVAAGADDVDASRPGTSMVLACSYMARTRPVISSTVSPLARSATAKPAICTSVASPLMMRSIAQAVSSALRSSPRQQGGQHARARSGPPRCRLRPGSQRSWSAPGGRHSAAYAGTALHPIQRPGTAQEPRPSDWTGLPGVVASVSVDGDQWWPWPLVISLYSSAVGFGIWLSSP